jgi:predicted XRE-type DNA-binding protein
MTLAQWIENSKKSRVEVARLLRVTPARLDVLITGRFNHLRPQQMRRIWELTDGQVDANDMYGLSH